MQGRNLPGSRESPKPENKRKLGEGEQSGRRQLGCSGRTWWAPGKSGSNLLGRRSHGWGRHVIQKDPLAQAGKVG